MASGFFRAVISGGKIKILGWEKLMTACVGLIILFGIVLLIAFLNMKNKQDSSRTAQFYRRHSLIPITEIPAKIFEAVGVEKMYSRQGSLKTADAQDVPFYWCEWSNQSTVTSGNSRTVVYDYYVAAAFSPENVSDEFVRKAVEFMNKTDEDFAQKAKDLFVLNTEKPIRADKLSDGGFMMWWRAKNLAEDYERIFLWLQNNISLREKAEKMPEISEELPVKNEVKSEIERLSIESFLEEMTAENYNESRDIINLTDAFITDYHDHKGHSNMSPADCAEYLGLSLEEVKSASAAITEIEFSPEEFLAKGFQIPELLEYEHQLAYRLNFPSRPLIYLDRDRIFLDDSSSSRIYFR